VLGAVIMCDAFCMYDMKKQLASMALTLRNVAVLDTKIDNFDASLTRMVKYSTPPPPFP
jgi:hypothetical protein